MSLISILVALVLLSGALSSTVTAQSDTNPWAPAVNVSQSGAASRPVIATAPDGTLHSLWWDTTEGQLYARTTTTDTTTWTSPSSVRVIYGSRITDTLTDRVTLAPPRDVRLISDSHGQIFALWIDATDQLQSTQPTDAGSSNSISLADAASTLDVAADADGNLHLAYIRPVSTGAAPAGIYYRSSSGTRWNNSSLVHDSAYLRTVKPEDAHLSVAGNGHGQVLVAWDDPQIKQSLYARSSDGGVKWSNSQVITSTQGGRSQHALVASVPNGEFLLLWQDTNMGGCGFVQRQSTDGGQTWSEPERVLSAVSHCDAKWSFMPSEGGRLWLVGRSGASGQNPNAGGVTVAAWDGKTWSEPKDLTLNFFDTKSNRSVSLNCPDVAIAGKTAGLAGCDLAGDVWATRNTVDLANLLPSLTTVWSPINVLTARSSPATTSDSPDLIADNKGQLFAAWSQSDDPGQLGTTLYASAWNNGQWSNASKVGQGSSTVPAGGTQPTEKAEQPALAADGKDRVHLVWSGGSDSRILYSWAYARDIGTAQGWSEPATLSAPGSLGRWPDIVAHPRQDDLYVVYAVPFNEQRGIYLTHSIDGGASWISRTVIFDAAAAGWDSVDKPRLALDASKNILHAVWMRTPLPGTTGSPSIYYARSMDDGQTWSAPAKVAEGVVDWPRVVVPAAGQVYLAWNQSTPLTGNTQAEVWGQYSPDGGERWSAPAAIHGLDRVAGPVGLTADGTGPMYIAGVGQGPGGESTLTYAKWNGQAWEGIESFRLGQSAMSGNSAAIAASPQAGRLGVALHLWMLKPDGAGQFDTAVTDRTIPAAAAPLAPAPTFTPLPSTPLAPTATPEPTATPRPQLTGPEQKAPTQGTMPPPLVFGGLLAVVIVVIVISRTVWTRRQ